MATVIRTTEGQDTIWTISSLYPQIAINSLFSFINYNGSFRISEDGGNNWTSWTPLTENDLRGVVVDLESSNVVVQFKNTVTETLLAINDGGDLLNINDDGDNLRV